MRFRARTILAILGIVLSVALMLQVVWLARGVLTWIIIAIFLALALNPAVDWLVARKLKRSVAVALVCITTVLAIVGIIALFIPTLVDEVNKFRDAVPGYVDDVTTGAASWGNRRQVRPGRAGQEGPRRGRLHEGARRLRRAVSVAKGSSTRSSPS